MSKTQKDPKFEKLTPNEITENYEHFKQIIDENLMEILNSRPKNPVSLFAKNILNAAGLDENGDPIEGIE